MLAGGIKGLVRVAFEVTVRWIQTIRMASEGFRLVIYYLNYFGFEFMETATDHLIFFNAYTLQCCYRIPITLFEIP